MNIKKIKPLFTAVVVTADIYPRDYKEHNIISPKANKLKEYQKVVAVGDLVRGIKEGDLVCIDPTRYMVTKHRDKSLHNNIVGDEISIGYKFNTIKLDDKECLVLYDQDISFIIEQYEEIDDPTGPRIIQPEKPKIIV